MELRLFMIPLVALLGFVALASCSSTPGRVSDSSCPATSDREKPCPAHRVPPRYPDRALNNGGEALVLVEYDVLEDGSTSEIGVVYRIGHEIFEGPAIKAMRSWRYRPATKDGQPVRTKDLRVAIPFRIGKQLGARRDAVRQLTEAYDAINRRDLPRAKEALAAMNGWKWPNLYEDQQRSLVRGAVAHLEGRYLEALGGLRRARLFDGKYAGEYGRVVSLVWTVRAAHLAERDGHAYHAGKQLEQVRGARTLPADITKIMSELEERRDGRGTLRTDLTIRRADSRYREPRVDYFPLRRAIRIESTSDPYPTRLHADCDDHEENWTPTRNSTFAMPDRWGDCDLSIYGAPGTNFTIVEPPSPENEPSGDRPSSS